MDQLQDVKNQLCENVSIRAPILFIGCALCHTSSSPAHSLGNAKQLGQLLLSVIPQNCCEVKHALQHSLQQMTAAFFMVYFYSSHSSICLGSKSSVSVTLCAFYEYSSSSMPILSTYSLLNTNMPQSWELLQSLLWFPEWKNSPLLYLPQFESLNFLFICYFSSKIFFIYGVKGSLIFFIIPMIQK